MNKCQIIIYRSEVDKIYIAEMPELKGCIAHGNTQEEALKEINLLAEEWLKIAKENDRIIPEPKGKLIFA